jgi:outer membrane protein OmpA-like peptidoglycan-associated protein
MKIIFFFLSVVLISFNSKYNLEKKEGETTSFIAEKLPSENQLIENYKSLADSIFFVGDRVLIPNLEFSGGRIFLQSLEQPIFDSLVDFLNLHSTMIIQIENHSSSRGRSESNLVFTEGRAKNVQYALIESGIDKSRISFKGYGESELIISDDIIKSLPTDKEKKQAHLQNERTVFLILKL